MDETTRSQEIADKVNLGKHQHLIEVETEDGATWRFVVHRPTGAEQVRIGVQHAMLRTPPARAGEGIPQAVELEDHHGLLAYFIASLNVVVDLRPPDCPKDFGDLVDTQVIIDLFNAYEEWRNSFRRQLPGESRGDSGPAVSAAAGLPV